MQRRDNWNQPSSFSLRDESCSCSSCPGGCSLQTQSRKEKRHRGRINSLTHWKQCQLQTEGNHTTRKRNYVFFLLLFPLRLHCTDKQSGSTTWAQHAESTVSEFISSIHYFSFIKTKSLRLSLCHTWFSAPSQHHSQSTSPKQMCCPTTFSDTASHCRSSSLPCRHLNGQRADPLPLTFPVFLYQKEQEPGTKAGFLPPLFPMHCQFIQHRRAFRELHKGMLLKWQRQPKRAPGRAVCATTWGMGTGGAEWGWGEGQEQGSHGER